MLTDSKNYERLRVSSVELIQIGIIASSCTGSPPDSKLTISIQWMLVVVVCGIWISHCHGE